MHNVSKIIDRRTQNTNMHPSIAVTFQQNNKDDTKGN